MTKVARYETGSDIDLFNFLQLGVDDGSQVGMFSAHNLLNMLRECYTLKLKLFKESDEREIFELYFECDRGLSEWGWFSYDKLIDSPWKNSLLPSFEFSVNCDGNSSLCIRETPDCDPPFKHHLIVSCASQCSSNDDSKCEIFYRPNDTEPLTRSSALEVWINPFPNTDAVFQKAYMIVFRMHSFSGVHFQKYFLEGIIEPAIPEASVHKDKIFRNPNLLSLLKQAEKISITYTDFETSHIKQQTFFNGNGHETSWFDFNNVFYSTFWNFTVNTTSILDTVFYSEWGDQNEFGTAFLMKKILDQSNPYFISFWSEILTSYGTCVTNWTTLPELSQFPPENIQPPFIVYSQDQGPRMCGGHKMAEMISISVL